MNFLSGMRLCAVSYKPSLLEKSVYYFSSATICPSRACDSYLSVHNYLPVCFLGFFLFCFFCYCCFMTVNVLVRVRAFAFTAREENVIFFQRPFMSTIICCLYRLLITFANSLDPYQAQQNFGPDLDQFYLTLRWYS